VALTAAPSGASILAWLPNIALQLTRARSARQVRAERHFVPHRAFIIYGPSQLNAVLGRPTSTEEERK
jgi:hypothetical protein